MKSYYYLRLCEPDSYIPLEEYIGKIGIIQSRDDLDALLIFDSRDTAGEYLESVHGHYSDRVIQICLHLEEGSQGVISTYTR